ncbi:unnamed protein product [Rotaria sp. Silwood2]|nr:unnamed protein product [Rotaria sp. Silwood2]CAF4502245.1 unnamed protein product [Rotaria sp. Silwood2]
MESTITQFQNAKRQSTRETSYTFVLEGHPPETLTDNQRDLLKHLSCDFAQLLNRTDLSDCLLNVKGTYMAVHRCVLAARSNTFSAIMSGNNSRLDPDIKKGLETSVKNNKLVISIDKTLPEIMKQVIIFMYTAKCQLDERNAYGLLDAAGRYDIKSLKVYAAQFLINHINTNNVWKLIEASYVYGNILLKQKCIDYFIENGKEVMGITELWKSFADRHADIVSDLLYWTVHKDESHLQTD